MKIKKRIHPKEITKFLQDLRDNGRRIKTIKTRKIVDSKDVNLIVTHGKKL